jgi:hypothetical protein
MLGIEYRATHMQSKHSTTELYHSPFKIFNYIIIILVVHCDIYISAYNLP